MNDQFNLSLLLHHLCCLYPEIQFSFNIISKSYSLPHIFSSPIFLHLSSLTFPPCPLPHPSPPVSLFLWGQYTKIIIALDKVGGSLKRTIQKPAK